MMTCQVCGDTQGPWEYEEYISSNKKPWLIENGTIILVCEKCAKILRKRKKQEAKIKREYSKNHQRWQERLPIKEV